MYEEKAQSLRSASLLLYSACFANPSVRFLLLIDHFNGPYIVLDFTSFLTAANRTKYAAGRIIFDGHWPELRELASPFPPTLNLDGNHDTPPPTL